MQEKILITGYASINNLGKDKTQIWNSYTLPNINHKYGELSWFNENEYLEKKGLTYMSRSQKLLLSAIKMMYDDEGISYDKFDNVESGVVIGNVFGSLSSITDFDKTTVVEGIKSVRPMMFSNCVKNSTAAIVSIKYGQKAFNVTLASGIASSLDAINYARDMLVSGKCKSVIAGGVEEYCNALHYGFEQTNMLVHDAEHYLSNEDQEGFALCEGVGVVLLQKESAVVPEMKVYGVLKGCKRRNFFNREDVEQKILKCMKGAIEDADIDIGDIDMVMTNKNGISFLDYAENRAIDSLFIKNKKIEICSPKKYFGETYSASGAITINLAIQILEHQKNIKNILINGFDFSGQLVSIVIGAAYA